MANPLLCFEMNPFSGKKKNKYIGGKRIVLFSFFGCCFGYIFMFILALREPYFAVGSGYGRKGSFFNKGTVIFFLGKRQTTSQKKVRTHEIET